ncbi:hypothetical protein J437_LFUL003477 [Ladona fulva]|uniref:Uncharacterized protein n=1 Tax=Ladona fulva TaxID=123851 RepID=A0A8K0NXP5_LADFU|nr:hypothetical protein J437_LFUL003477 [Ladona fulva]
MVKVYGGNPQLRDWSGRMPRQYIVSQDTSVSSETFRSEYKSTPSPPNPPSSDYSRDGGKKRWLLVEKSKPRTVTSRPTSTADISLPKIQGQEWRRASIISSSVTQNQKVHPKQESRPKNACTGVILPLFDRIAEVVVNPNKMKARKKHSEKELGFLRIGSLNVRVKRTTEAFSNFLGVGSQNSNSGSNYSGSGTSSSEKIHKSWGSADNIQEVDRRAMPPPKNPSKKRRSKMTHQLHHHRSQQELVHLNTVPSRATVSHSALPDSVSSSTPASPTLRRASNPDTKTGECATQPSLAKEVSDGVVLRHAVGGNGGDSDSDTACGFGSNWKATV